MTVEVNRQNPRQRGFALLIVLWTLVLITLLVTQLTAAGRGQTGLATNLRQAARLRALADGEVQEAIFHLMDRSPARWQIDGQVREVRLPPATAQIRLADEAGRINPSTAPSPVLEALLHGIGVDAGRAAALAGAIVQWRTPAGRSDTDTEGIAAYRAAGRSVGPSGAPFVSMDELGAVMGMTPDVLAKLAPHISLFAEGDPDPRTSDPIVRQALATRSGVPALRPSGGAGQIRVIAITATVGGPGGARFTRRAVVRLTDNEGEQGFRILAWEEPANA